MPIELVPRPKAKPKRIVSILFYLSLILLILTVAGYIGLYSINDRKGQELEELRNVLDNQETRELRILKEELKEYQGKVNDLSFLLSSYREPLKFLEFLEGVTHPKVRWVNMSIDLAEGGVSISGEADSLTTLIQQVLILEADPRIEDFMLSGFTLKESGAAGFSVDFTLTPQLFK